jgi:hypothetical protein
VSASHSCKPTTENQVNTDRNDNDLSNEDLARQIAQHRQEMRWHQHRLNTLLAIQRDREFRQQDIKPGVFERRVGTA